MPDSLANDIFLLMLNLSQLQDQERIVQVFTEALNSRLEGARVVFAPADAPAPAAATDDEVLTVATAHQCYGRMLLNGGRSLAPAIRALVHNAVGMLALILENRVQAQLLRDEKAHLDYQVAQRTAELTQANLRLSREVEERARAQEALWLSEERLRVFFENAADAIFIADLEGRLVQVNQQACVSTGYSRAELLRLNVNDLDVDFASPDELRATLAALIPGESATFETRHRRKDGSIYPAEVRVVRFDSPDGLRVMGIARDVSERRRAEKELANLAAIVASSEESIIGMDPAGIITSWNFGAERLYGYAAAEAVGRSIAMLIPPGHRDLDLGFLNRVAAGEKVRQYETTRTTKDGRLLHLSMTLSPMRDEQGQLIGVSGIARDISARKKAEEALRKSEEKFAKAFNASPVWVAVTTVDEGRFLEVNDTFTTISGYTRAEAVGRTSFDLGFWLDPARDRQRALEVFRREGRFHNLETPMRFKDGKVHTMLWSVDPLEFEGQECFINVLVDISEQKKAQEEKANLEAQLRQAQKMEAIGTLAGGIAHDFNNILAAVLGFAEMAHQDAKSGAVNPADLEQVIASAQRAKHLIQQIMAFSRKNEPDFKVINLNRVIAAAKAILERTLPKMIDIELRLDEKLIAVLADPNQVEQVLLNLASNAADAMPDGGRLTIETQQVELDQEYCRQHLEARPGPHALLIFSDTGQGMDAATLEHIFEPFYTTKAVGKGTGLGLSTAYGIIKSHSGHIHCYSEPGLGTSFKIYLPAYQRVPLAPAESGGPADESGLAGHEAVLLVDDEESLRTLGARNLKSKGYQVLLANSGEEALEVFRQGGRPDLVVMDLNMPGMGGQKALKAILDLAPQAKVVIASGYSADSQVREAMACGAAGYVAKPFRRADLLTTVRRVLDAK